MAKYDLLEPMYDDLYLTNAKYIQGGYFVVEKYADLSGLTVVDSEYPTVGTIVKGSLCYCQKEETFYQYNGSDWVAANLGGGGGIVLDDAPETPTENLTFNRLDDDTYEVSGIKDPSDSAGNRTSNIYTNVVIPSSHDGKLVTQIASHAFDSCSKLVNVKIPNSIQRIYEKAFHKCTSLKYVEIPESVYDLGSNGGAVFEHCSGLEWASIPYSVKIIGAYTFNGCTNATLYCGSPKALDGWAQGSAGWNPSGCQVVWNTYVETIKNRTTISLYGSTYVTSKGLFVRRNMVDDIYMVVGMGECTDSDLVIPPTHNGKRITSIDSRAFENSASIKTVVTGQNVETIGSYAFKNCPNLTKVTITDSVTILGRSMGEVFANCSSLETVSIPKSVTQMGVNMFKGCKNAVIICEAVTQPSGWLDTNLSGCTVVRGVQLDLTVDIAEVMSLSARLAALEETVEPGDWKYGVLTESKTNDDGGVTEATYEVTTTESGIYDWVYITMRGRNSVSLSGTVAYDPAEFTHSMDTNIADGELSGVFMIADDTKMTIQSTHAYAADPIEKTILKIRKIRPI